MLYDLIGRMWVILKVLKSRKGNNIIAMLVLITIVALLIGIIYPPFLDILTNFGGLVENSTTYYSFIQPSP
jgi:hypothetical protein